MTVKELIKQLLNYPENTEVLLCEQRKGKSKGQEYLYSYYEVINDCRICYKNSIIRNEPIVEIDITDYSRLLK